MPHISIKMLKGRTDAQKEQAAQALKKALIESIGCGESHVSVSVEDYTAKEWQDIFEKEITAKGDKVLIKPGYDPKSLL